MSLRPLNQQTAKSQFRAPLTFTKDEYHQFLKLGGISVGYVIATSEPADIQVSISSLLTFTKDKSQSRALLTFTKDRSRYLLTFTKDKYHQILKLGGVSIGYVIATSEPADSQVSISSLLTFTKDKSQSRTLLTFTKDRSRYLLTFTKDKYHQP